jgi:hypothetical protein
MPGFELGVNSVVEHGHTTSLSGSELGFPASPEPWQERSEDKAGAVGVLMRPIVGCHPVRGKYKN